MTQILVVDDVPGVRHSIVSILKRAGHIVEEADGCTSALEKVAHFRPEIVVTDVMMPEIDGVETMDRLKQKIPTAKFVAVSGGGSLVQADEALTMAAIEADATLAKPFGNDELIKVITSVMES